MLDICKYKQLYILYNYFIIYSHISMIYIYIGIHAKVMQILSCNLYFQYHFLVVQFQFSVSI